MFSFAHICVDILGLIVCSDEGEVGCGVFASAFW